MSDLVAQGGIASVLVTFLASYAIGSIPNAYLIVRLVSGEDVRDHGSGTVCAMNVRRTTGSWGWFTVAMLADALKGLVPTALVSWLLLDGAWPIVTEAPKEIVVMAAVAGAVVGHNYSMWLAIKNRRLGATGKGLATGGGALLAYDFRYFLLVLAVGLAIIAVTRVMMAGQVAAAVSLPVYTIVTQASDWPFAVVLGAAVYLRHHRRFVGMIAGEEPKLYVDDGQGPRG